MFLSGWLRFEEFDYLAFLSIFVIFFINFSILYNQKRFNEMNEKLSKLIKEKDDEEK